MLSHTGSQCDEISRSKHVFRPSVYLSSLTGGVWSSRSKWSGGELKPALWSKRITAEHHPVSMARWKSFLTLTRTLSVLCVLGPDWPYYTFAYCTLRYSELSAVALAGKVNTYCQPFFPLSRCLEHNWTLYWTLLPPLLSGMNLLTLDSYVKESWACLWPQKKKKSVYFTWEAL